MLTRATLQVNVSTDPERSVDITNGDKIIVDYTYSVNWREGSTPYERRMEKYSRYSFLPQHLEVRHTSRSLALGERELVYDIAYNENISSVNICLVEKICGAKSHAMPIHLIGVTQKGSRTMTQDRQDSNLAMVC